MNNIKKRIFDIIQADDGDDKASKIFDLFIIGLIILNVITVIADTFSMPESLQRISRYIEIFSVVIFTIEYILRVWTSDMLYPWQKPVIARIRYIVSFMALVDLFAILPFYLPLLIPIDLRVLRLLRVIRLLRIFKVSRYTNALSVVGNVLKKKRVSSSHQCLSLLF